MRQEKREMVYGKAKGFCGYCGTKIKFSEMQVDHIIPKKHFYYCILNDFQIPDFLTHLTIEDLDNLDNLMPTCRECNIAKSSHTLESFRNEISKGVCKLYNNPQFKRAVKFGLLSIQHNKVIFFYENIKNFGLLY